MKLRHATIVAALLVVAAVAVFVWTGRSRGKQSAEELLLAAVQELARAATERDTKAIARWISKDYRDAEGRDRKTLLQMLSLRFRAGGVITVFVLDKDVTVQHGVTPLRGALDVLAVLARIKAASLSELRPEAVQAMRFAVQVQQADGRWGIVAAEWAPVENVADLLRSGHGESN